MVICLPLLTSKLKVNVIVLHWNSCKARDLFFVFELANVVNF